jgi:hypothetical protein
VLLTRSAPNRPPPDRRPSGGVAGVGPFDPQGRPGPAALAVPLVPTVGDEATSLWDPHPGYLELHDLRRGPRPRTDDAGQQWYLGTPEDSLSTPGAPFGNTRGRADHHLGGGLL